VRDGVLRSIPGCWLDLGDERVGLGTNWQAWHAIRFFMTILYACFTIEIWEAVSVHVDSLYE